MRNALSAAHEAPEYVHLGLHEGDERRDDYRRAVHDEGRQLVTQGLAPSGRHEHEGVASAQKMVYNPLLVALEIVVTEKFLECLVYDSRIVHQ